VEFRVAGELWRERTGAVTKFVDFFGGFWWIFRSF
jgi:hypothetical protein